MEHLLHYSIYVVAYMLAFYCLAFLMGKNFLNKNVFLILIASIATYIVAFKGSKIPLHLGNQLSIFQESEEVKHLLHTTAPDDPGIDSFISNNFHLVNINTSSKDNQDIKHILAKLSEINSNTPGLITLVVLDGYFRQIPSDSLKQYINNLSDILIFGDSPVGGQEAIKQIYGNNMASIGFNELGDRYIEEELITGNSIPSMAYKIYSKISGDSIRRCKIGPVALPLLLEKNGSTRYAFENFIPTLYPQTEDPYSAESLNNPDVFSNSPSNLSGKKYIPYMYDGTYEAGLTDLKYNMLESKRFGHKFNIVFVGSFCQPEFDVHNTIHGQFHGAMIIINVVYNLIQHRHKFRFPYLMFLWAGFFIIFLSILYRSIGIDNKAISFAINLKKMLRRKITIYRPAPASTGQPDKKKFGFFHTFLYIFFVEEMHYWILLIIYFIAYIHFNMSVNILSLSILIALIEKIFKRFAELHLSPDKNKAS